MEKSLETHCDNNNLDQCVKQKTTGTRPGQLLYQLLSSSQKIDYQIFNQMRGYFSTPSMSADSSQASISQPKHYIWPAIVTNSQFLESLGEKFSQVDVSPISSRSCQLLSASNKNKHNSLSIDNQNKDDAYLKRRKKKNESSKRYRELKKIMEQENIMQLAFLEQENLNLRAEVEKLNQIIGKMRK